MTHRRQGFGIVAALALSALVLAPGAPAATTVTAAAIAKQLRSGEPVVAERWTVLEDLNLERADVAVVFKCRRCTFQGKLNASDATFARAVDLSGSTFEDAVDFTGAAFRGPALFRKAIRADEERPLVFEDSAEFSLAVFDDLASFAGAEFEDASVFLDTRFADATFAQALFDYAARFERASFRGAASFTSAEFAEDASFGNADFRQRSDFTSVVFEGDATFDNAQFVGGVSFLAAEFGARTLVSFDGVASSGNVDLTFASFDAGPGGARFEDLVSSKSLVLRDTTIHETRQLDMFRLQVADLVMDVDLAQRIADESVRRKVLQTIEESAKERGDLGLANDAQYALRVLVSDGYGPLTRMLDRVFYREIAGYLVRPLRPLLVLALVLLFAAAVRFLARRRKQSAEPRVDGAADEPPPTGGRWRRASRTAWRNTPTFVAALLDTAARVGPRWRGESAPGQSPPLAERFELIAYRVLLVLALVGLANSNPTLRQMVDTLA